MGAVKKAYMDYCDKNNIPFDEDEAESLGALASETEGSWRAEFADWLEKLSQGKHHHLNEEGDDE